MVASSLPTLLRLSCFYYLWFAGFSSSVRAQDSTNENSQATLENCAIRINQVDTNSNLRLEKSEFDILVNVDLGGCNSNLVDSIFYNFACPQCDSPLEDIECCPRPEDEGSMTSVPLDFMKFTFCAILSSAIVDSCPMTTASPTKDPTMAPIVASTKEPTGFPTAVPTGSPTTAPTLPPSPLPTKRPTKFPTTSPTGIPTSTPTSAPTTGPTSSPLAIPTISPTASPTMIPTTSPQPTAGPTNNPSMAPTPFPRLDQSVTFSVRIQVSRINTTNTTTNSSSLMVEDQQDDDDVYYTQILLPIMMVGLDALAIESSLFTVNGTNSTPLDIKLPVRIQEWMSIINDDDGECNGHTSYCASGYATMDLINVTTPEVEEFSSVVLELVSAEKMLLLLQDLLPVELELQDLGLILIETDDDDVSTQSPSGSEDTNENGVPNLDDLNITTIPPTLETNNGDGNDDDDEAVLSTTAIIVIVSVVGGILAIVLFCCCCFDRIDCCDYRIECCFYEESSDEEDDDDDDDENKEKQECSINDNDPANQTKD